MVGLDGTKYLACRKHFTYSSWKLTSFNLPWVVELSDATFIYAIEIG